MKQKATKIKLHGVLGESIGKSDWNLHVESVGEAVRAIEMLSKRKLYKFLLDNDKKGLRYRVLINGRDFESQKPLNDPNDLESIGQSELAMKFKELKSIDFIPIIEGAGDGTTATILGALLIVIGVVLLAFGGAGTVFIIAGIGLLAAGITNLLTNPPKIETFQEIQSSRQSYLFSGPQNTTREGGPVPVGYGRLIVGSQVIAASYEISHVNADLNPLTS